MSVICDGEREKQQRRGFKSAGCPSFFSAISLLTVKSSVTGNWLQFRRFCTLNNFIINIIDYLGWIFIFLQSLVLCQFMMKDYKVLKEK